MGKQSNFKWGSSDYEHFIKLGVQVVRKTKKTIIILGGVKLVNHPTIRNNRLYVRY